jgi:N-sulfoglucosamine sulfohydrolase
MSERACRIVGGPAGSPLRGWGWSAAKWFGAVASMIVTMLGSPSAATAADQRPNVFFAIADDWGWPHAGVYGDKVVETPTFDRLAREGVMFTHAYVAAPSCTPSRNAIFTGQWHWRLGPGANLWSTFPADLPTYPLILEKAGYYCGHFRKSFGPGKLSNQPHPAGPHNLPFKKFLDERPKDTPFCFWFGTSDPHRPYKLGSGKESGMDLSKVHLFACFPDAEEVRSDIADYYWEVQRFDREVGEAIAEMERRGLLDNTIVVMTGDHGMPFPRCKGNLYDSGTRIPLAIRWPAKIKPGRVVSDFVSTTDLAPTYLEAAGLKPPDVMTGRSLMNVLTATSGGGGGRIDPTRDHVLTGKERHVACQEAPDSGGTPMRAIRTDDFLYIRNYRPDRWPAGTPNDDKAYLKGSWYGDIDGGPTKDYMYEHRNDPAVKKLFELAFQKRPAEELYDVKKDPEELHNAADDPAYAAVKKKLAAQLTAELKATNDPREVGGGEKFDRYPYLGGTPKRPKGLQ